MNINLIPRKSMIDRLFMPALVTMLVLFIGCGSLLWYLNSENHSDTSIEQTKIDELNKRIQMLKSLHQEDARTKEYETFAAQVKQLQAERRDWEPVFDLISTHLLPASRLLAMNVNDKALLTLNLEFASLQQIADYLIMLQRSPLIENAITINVTLVKASKDIVNPQQDSSSLPIQPDSSNVESNSQVAEQPLNSLDMDMEMESIDSSFEGDQLLNQLQGIINKQSVEQHFNSDVTMSTEAETLLQGGIFSEQEIEEAKRAVEDLKQKETVDSSTSISSVPPVPSDKQAISVEMIADTSNDLVYYQVVMEIQLKSLAEGE